MSLWAVGTVWGGPGFDGRGRVTAVDASRNTVTIEHGAIHGLLPATRSEFPVQATGVVGQVRPGDRVSFTLGAPDGSHGLLTVVSLAAEGAGGAGWPDRLLTSVAVALGFLTLAAVVAAGIVLWQDLRALSRRVVALDRESGLLRELIADTQDGIRQIAGALDDAATILRVGYIQDLRRRLAAGAPPAGTETASGRTTGEAEGALVVVERGRGELYRAVESGAAGSGLAVIWDRRRTERRRSPRRPISHERRRSERRASPPETWTRLGFQVVPPDAADSLRVPRLLRAAGGERGAAR